MHGRLIRCIYIIIKKTQEWPKCKLQANKIGMALLITGPQIEHTYSLCDETLQLHIPEKVQMYVSLYQGED